MFRIAEVPQRGAKVPASHVDEIIGGNALNAAVGISRLGGRVTLCGPIGDKSEIAAGNIFAGTAQEGIETNLIHMDGLVTPISGVMIDPTGERTIVTFRDPALWKVKLPDPDRLLADSASLMVENRCAAFMMEVCAEARRRDIPVIVDVDTPMSLNDGLLAASSHMIFSSDALQATAGLADDLGALQKVAGLTTSFVAVTRGPKGTLWLDADGTAQETPAFPVHSVDTLGAGDIFHGAFALAITEGHELRAALRFASAAAALKCTRHGGAFACPDRAELEAFLSESKE